MNVGETGVAMSVRMARHLPLIFLLMMHRVSSANWSVSYSPPNICALKDSSVTIRCNYKYPTGHQIISVLWTKGKSRDFSDLFKDPEYSQRLHYLGDKQQNCTIKLSHLTKKDEHEYYFRFTTNVTEGSWTGKPGVSLNIADLQLESPEKVKEGDSVRLTCKSSCKLTDRPTFIWYRNSQPLTEKSNELLLQSVTREDAGRYRCAVHGHKITSPDVKLNVTYPPKSVSVSISGSAEIVSGDSVTLSCSSDFNPPSEMYWYKETKYAGSERILNISKISSDDNGVYRCFARNEHGYKYSDPVTLNVKYPPKNISLTFNGSAEIVSGDSVSLICNSDSNPPAEISWLKEIKYIGSGRIFNISKISSDDSGEYKCRARNELGYNYSDPLTLNVTYPPRNVSVSIGEIVSLGSLSLSCSSDSNPPAEISWFKENRSSAVGSGQSFSAVQSGTFYCEARNTHGSQRSDTITVTVKGHLFIICISFGVGCAALVVITMLLIWRKKRNITESQVRDMDFDNYESPLHDRYTACNVKSTEPVYGNILVNPMINLHDKNTACDDEFTDPIYENGLQIISQLAHEKC